VDLGTVEALYRLDRLSTQISNQRQRQ